MARALASDPKLFLLDEPASGLNETESQRRAHATKEIQKKGVTHLLVEHFVMNLCDQIIVLNYGEKSVKGLQKRFRPIPGLSRPTQERMSGN